MLPECSWWDEPPGWVVRSLTFGALYVALIVLLCLLFGVSTEPSWWTVCFGSASGWLWREVR